MATFGQKRITVLGDMVLIGFRGCLINLSNANIYKQFVIYNHITKKLNI